jgi:hypothetical protein
MKRPRRPKVHHATAAMKGEGTASGDPAEGRMLLGDELAAWRAMRALSDKTAAQAATQTRKPRPAPTRDRVVAAMARDYPTAAALRVEKLSALTARYKVGKSTVLAARSVILYGPRRTTDR